MPSDLHSRLTDIVNATVAQIEAALRASLADDVAGYIRGAVAARTAAPSPATARGPRGRRTRGVPDAVLDQVLKAVRENPGVRAEGVAPLTGLDRAVVKKALMKLRASGAVRTTGQKRATTYRVAGRGAAPAPAAPRSRKAATKKAKAVKRGKAPGRKGPPPGTRVKRISNAELKAVLDVLAKKPGLTSRQIQAEAKIDAKEAGRVLLKLRKTKRVTWKGERAAATYAVA